MFIIRIFAFLLILCFLAIGIEGATPIRPCFNQKPLPLMVQVENCHALPCNIWKGEITNVAIQFVATKDAMQLLNANVHLSTLGAQIPYELEDDRSNVCDNLMYGAYCPLYAQEDVTYNLLLELPTYQPEVLTKIEVTVVDRSDNSIVSCFVTDARVKHRN